MNSKRLGVVLCAVLVVSACGAAPESKTLIAIQTDSSDLRAAARLPRPESASDDTPQRGTFVTPVTANGEVDIGAIECVGLATRDMAYSLIVTPVHPDGHIHAHLWLQDAGNPLGPDVAEQVVDCPVGVALSGCASASATFHGTTYAVDYSAAANSLSIDGAAPLRGSCKPHLYPAQLGTCTSFPCEVTETY